MFDSYQKSTGTQYTATVALALAALVVSPAALLVSRPLGYPSVLIALSFTILCATLARMQWTRRSALTIPSFSAKFAGTK